MRIRMTKETIEIAVEIDGEFDYIALTEDQAKRFATQLRDLCTNGQSGESVAMKGFEQNGHKTKLIAAKYVETGPAPAKADKDSKPVEVHDGEE